MLEINLSEWITKGVWGGFFECEKIWNMADINRETPTTDSPKPGHHGRSDEAALRVCVVREGRREPQRLAKGRSLSNEKSVAHTLSMNWAGFKLLTYFTLPYSTSPYFALLHFTLITLLYFTFQMTDLWASSVHKSVPRKQLKMWPELRVGFLGGDSPPPQTRNERKADKPNDPIAPCGPNSSPFGLGGRLSLG